jgi:adenosylcobinamide-phosphate synthase
MASPVALAALALDAAIGWPDALYRRVGHPVGGFARLIDFCETNWNRPTWSDVARRTSGVVTVMLLTVCVGGPAWIVQHVLVTSLAPWGWIAVAVLSWPALAQRSLFDHLRPVATALEAGDLAEARRSVGRIVGRDAEVLDEAGVSRAAIESLAESFCDGVAAPLFWLLFLGLPGVWVYKAINTADSMIGHREERWRMFGWAAARADDLLNLLPARLSGVALCVAGGGGWRTLWRDAGKHASPNAGWPEAAMAGALGVRLAGPITYDGVVHDKDWIGDGVGTADSRAVRQALTIYIRSCLILWLIAGGVAWAL